MATWTLDFRGRTGVQTFRTARPAAGQEQAAADALWQASAELGIPPMIAAWYESRGPVDGYHDPADPHRAWIRAGLSVAETRRVALHEAGHAAHHRLWGVVGAEELPDRYSAGDRAARTWLDTRPSGLPRLIAGAVGRAVGQYRKEASR